MTLADRRVVVIGGDSGAQRRIPDLLAAGADVRLVAGTASPTVAGYVTAGLVSRVPRDYRYGDLADAWYVVVTTADDATRQRVRAEAEERRIFYEEHAAAGGVARLRNRSGDKTGRVTLVGGGPGDPDLITVAGRRAVENADVVVVDRLAPQGLLARLPADVEVVDAAKLPRGFHTSQEAINAVLVDRARRGCRVVRLKGGDAFVFGRGFEEVQACAQAQVRCEVVPGVTNVVSAPALAGIPVTHRGVTHSLTVVSGHVAPGHPDSLVDWSSVAKVSGTLVLLMAMHNLDAIATALLAGGANPHTPVAVVQDGSLHTQRSLTCTLATVAARAAEQGLRSPATVVIGEVVALSQREDSCALVS